MPDTQIDLDGYFSRIGYAGPREPTLEVLTAIQFAHATSIPFENLSILFGKGVKLDLPTLQDKIVGSARGGYCFEQNGLALAVLKQLGFDAFGLVGRVRWMVSEDQAAPLTHMLIHVTIDGKVYIYDGGFGGVRLTGVLELVPDLVQPTRHEDHRLVKTGIHYTVQVDLSIADAERNWADVCQFTLEPQSPVDYELGSWYTSTHPDSLFVNNLIVERPFEGGRRMIFNDTFVERLRGCEQTVHVITSVEEMIALLGEHFDLKVSGDEERTVLAGFVCAPD
ncbi:MAG: arylamine N-acetyltransferase [Rhodobiaceae bacterium]|nr:MAG: arylamine N-acetyltransferase [Rhodobiaceae bacterium]